MVEILRGAYVEKRRRRGRTPKLSIEDLLLATLEYLREYRTYSHIAANYGIVSLPGRKALLKSDMEYEVILVDATESPIERPQKGKNGTIP